MSALVGVRSVLARFCSPATLRPVASAYSTNSVGEKWEIYTAVCLERLPVVTRPLNDLQKKFKAHLEEVETQQSLKSDHELRHEQDIITAQKIKDETINIDELETMSKNTAHDFEDASNEELAQFKFGSIVTDADKKNDQTSLSRRLQSHLVLLVEQELGKEKKFVLPQGKHQDGLTLRQAAEKVLKESCGEDVNAVFFGNAPCGFMKYKWRNEKKETTGVKLFFYYARHVSGDINSKSNHKWLTREELRTSLAEKYHNALSDFLVEERP